MSRASLRAAIAPISRRTFLAAGASIFTASRAFPNLGAPTGAQHRLLVVNLRGGLDGLSAIAPVGDPDYVNVRGAHAISKTGKGAGLAVTDFFLFHPALKTLATLCGQGSAFAVHASAGAYRGRSHFDAQDILESGYPVVARDYKSGWLGRTLEVLAKQASRPVTEGLSVGMAPVLMLKGSQPIRSWAPESIFNADPALAERILSMYSQTDEALFGALRAGLETLGVAAPDNSSLPTSRLARAMHAASIGAAKIISRPDGPNIGVLCFDGWDTHVSQVGQTGRLATLLDGLDAAIAGIYQELRPLWTNSTVLVITEFGRTVRINGTNGSDHGAGTVMFVLGGAINAPKVVADWPGLKQSNLFQGRDLTPTIDTRSILKTLLKRRLGVDERYMDFIFPQSGHVNAIDIL